MRLFKQRKARLFDGTIIHEGDIVQFKTHDGKIIDGPIRRRSNRTLYFHNIDFKISDYRNLKLVYKLD